MPAKPKPGSPLNPLPVPPRTILLVKTSSLGDVVHNLPVVSDLRHQFPEAQIDWVVEEGFADIPRLHHDVRRVIPFALRRWRKQLLNTDNWREIRAFRHNLRVEAYDVVLDTQGLIKSGLVTGQALLSATGRRCGYVAEVAREPLAARFYQEGFAIPRNVHAVERNRWLAAAAFDYTPDLPLNYGLQDVTDLVADWLPAGAYVVLLTASSREDKLWPEDCWRQLMVTLAARDLRCILPSGTPAERERAQRLSNWAMTTPSAVVAPPLSIAELAGLCAGAQAVIGVDTGLTHLAVALGRPTLALFAGSDPQLTGVYAGDPPISIALNLGAAGKPPTLAEATAALIKLGLPR